ncbi:MAG: hypothetical protein HYW85_01940 [Deltaproteobacteria bacterium]|nr:hypothetical protein [Deltaproteobacteria bacterium]
MFYVKIKGIVVFFFFFFGLLFSFSSFAQFSVLQMQQKRVLHRSTLLKDGNVLITGGVSSLKPIPWPISHAELFLAREKRFVSLSSMNASHTEHTTTLLNNGNVVVTGGNLNPTLEIFDSQRGVFHSLRAPLSARAGHTVHVMNDKLFLMGGYYVSIHFFEMKGMDLAPRAPQEFGYDLIALKDCEIYDLKTQTSRLIPFPSWIPKLTFHRSVQLSNGHIIIVGGMGGREKVIEFNPETEEFSLRGTLAVPREDHEMDFLDDHRLFITGGTDQTPKTVASMEIFDLTTNRSELLPFSLHEAREDHSLVPLKEGLFMVVGGEIHSNPDIILKSAELINLNKGTVTLMKDLLPEGRSDHQTTVLNDGSLLITGGEAQNGTILSSAPFLAGF